MVKHTRTIHLRVFDHFVGLALNWLNTNALLLNVGVMFRILKPDRRLETHCKRVKLLKNFKLT